MKHWRAYTITLLAFLLQVVLAFTPFFEITSGWWHVDDPMKFYSVLATFIGVDIALVTLTFALLFLSESNTFRDQVRRLVDRVPASAIRWLPGQSFYRAFLAAAEEATDSVRIAYFAAVPPDAVALPGRKRYYDDMEAVIRTRTTVQFYRIVRYTAANENWILKLLREFTGVPNMSLAILTDDLAPERSMPLALSVQVVDSDRSWIVAIEAHERQGPYRDLFVENMAFADAMTRYYRRLWTIAKPLLENGQPTTFALELTARSGTTRA